MQNDNWIEWKWTPEKPYPETLETRVVVKFIDGTVIGVDWPYEVRFWHEPEFNEMCNWYDSGYDYQITHYRIAED